MSSVDVSKDSVAGSPPVKAGEMRLEVVVVPVSDVDRAKRFYESLGWRLDADFTVDEGYRIVQLTPPGSGCSIIFGDGVTRREARLLRGPAARGLRHRRDPRRARRARRRGQRAVPRRDRGLPPRRARGPRRRSGAGPCRLRLVRRLQRSGRQRLAAAGDPDAAPGPLRRHEQRLRRDRDRRRLARRALRGRAGRGRPARGRGRARARRRRVLVLGVHPVEDAAAAGRGGPRGARGGRDRRGRRRGGARLARLHGLGLLRRRAGALAGARTASTCCAAPAGSPARASSRSTACATPPTTSSSRTEPTRSCRPSPGLRELEGVWTNREATGMKAVPRRLLILGGGPVGVELAQAVRRLGGEAVLVEMSEHVLAREPAPLGEALGEVLRRDGIELVLSANATAARRDGDDYVLELDDGRELRGDQLLVATGRRPRVRGRGPRDRRGRAGRARRPRRRAPARGGASLGDRRRQRPLAADPRRQVPGRRRRREHPRRAAQGQLRGRAARDLHGSAGGGGRRRAPAASARWSRCPRSPRPPPTRAPTPRATASSRSSATASG